MDNDWLGFFNRNRLSINLPERLPVPREVLDFATRRGPPFFSSQVCVAPLALRGLSLSQAYGV